MDSKYPEFGVAPISDELKREVNQFMEIRNDYEVRAELLQAVCLPNGEKQKFKVKVELGGGSVVSKLTDEIKAGSYKWA
jgi:hypothetical protein